MLTVWNALLMSSATVIVRSASLFWLKPVAMMLFMLYSLNNTTAKGFPLREQSL